MSLEEIMKSNRLIVEELLEERGFFSKIRFFERAYFPSPQTALFVDSVVKTFSLLKNADESSPSDLKNALEFFLQSTKDISSTPLKGLEQLSFDSNNDFNNKPLFPNLLDYYTNSLITRSLKSLRDVIDFSREFFYSFALDRGLKLSFDEGLKRDSSQEGPGEESSSFLIKNLQPLTLDDVGGLEKQKELLREAVELPLLKSDEYERLGVSKPKGCILYGPPGTGKTFIMKSLAYTIKASFLYASGTQFLNKLVGEGARLLRSLREEAEKNAPSIVFIDEVDSITMNRDSWNGQVSYAITNEFLTMLDGFNPLKDVQFVFATNALERLDHAFVDRLKDYLIHFPLPDKEARFKIFQAITKRMVTEGLDLEKAASLSEGFNGRDISYVCNKAGLYVIKEGRRVISQSDLDRALEYYLEVKRSSRGFLRE